MQKKLILASQSPYRKELLERLGVSFECISPNIDEDKAKDIEPDVFKLTQLLAKQKSKVIAAAHPGAVIIGSDQAIILDNIIYSKPGTIQNAVKQLESLSGKTHKLVTAVCISHMDKDIEFSHTTHLTMRKLSKDELLAYVERDMPLDCAGSYMIEKAGISLFEKVETTDFTSIIGLPLIELTTHLKSLGFSIP